MLFSLPPRGGTANPIPPEASRPHTPQNSGHLQPPHGATFRNTTEVEADATRESSTTRQQSTNHWDPHPFPPLSCRHLLDTLCYSRACAQNVELPVDPPGDEQPLRETARHEGASQSRYCFKVPLNCSRAWPATKRCQAMLRTLTLLSSCPPRRPHTLAHARTRPFHVL